VEEIVAIINPTKRLVHRWNARTLGPPLAFSAAVLLASAPLAASATMPSTDLAFAVSSALLFVLAALVALFAWGRGSAGAGSEVTYRDVAGALILLGACAAALVEPDQLVRLVESAQRDH
jgi:hypothetical protein